MIKQTKNKPHIYLLTFIVAVLISYLALFQIGNLGSIVAYGDGNNLPKIKLELLKVVLIALTSISNFYILKEIVLNKKIKITKSPGILIVSFILSVLSMGILGYENAGSYLRDYHGINWFFMDMAKWMITSTLFFLSLYTALIIKIIVSRPE